MRITFDMTAQSSLRNIEANSKRMSDLEAQITSSSRISKPSDDPVGTARALNFQQSIDQSNQYLKNIDQGTNWLNSTDSALNSVSDDVQRARELAVQAANGTNTPEDKTAIASEIHQLQLSVLDLSNTKLGSDFLFSGTKSNAPGYLQAVSSTDTAVGAASSYQGNDGSIQREVTPGVTVGVNASAQATFDPIFQALTTLQAGLTPGSATPTAAVITGSGPLKTSNVGGTLTINGTAVTIANGATPTAIVADINAAGTGATASLSSTGNLVLTSNPAKGPLASVSIDAATGTIATDLGVTVGATAAGGTNDEAASLQLSLTQMDNAIDAIDYSRSMTGAKMNRLTTLQGQQTAVNTNLVGLLSQVKDVDMAAAITAYTSAQTVYQASLKSSAQSIQPSLLDFLK